MSRDLREQLVQLTYRDDEPRLSRVAEHLVRAIDEFGLAARDYAGDDTTAACALQRARLQQLELAQSVLAILESQRRRAVK